MTYLIPLLFGSLLESIHLNNPIQFYPVLVNNFISPRISAITLYISNIFIYHSIFFFQIKPIFPTLSFLSSVASLIAALKLPFIMSSFNLNKRVKINFYQPLPEFSKNFTLQLCSLTLFLLIISNTSILNPGPTANASGLNIFFQNIQGLITFSSLGKPYPDLNQTKISELQAHILSTCPDIMIMLNINIK